MNVTECIARATVVPDGEVVLEPAGEPPPWGTVDVEWYADRVTVTVRGVGRACLTEEYGSGEDVVLEVRIPALDELAETLPGAD